MNKAIPSKEVAMKLSKEEKRARLIAKAEELVDEYFGLDFVE